MQMCLKKMFFLKFSRSSNARAGPIRAHMGPYALMDPKKFQKICKQIALLGAFKGPVTLP